MIVDCHTHVFEAQHVTEEYLAEVRRVWGERAWRTVELEQHWRDMEPVDRAIVLAFQGPQSGMVVPNQYVADYVRRHPDKLIGFASVDPHAEDAPAQLEYAAKELGLRGLKLGPIYQQFDPTDRSLGSLYRKVEELGLPILWHQGTTFLRRAPLKVANPILLDSVAAEFPAIRMVIAHMGHPWIAEAVVVARKHPYVYLDISALVSRPWQFYNGMIVAEEYGIGDKLLFGSDYPAFTPAATRAALEQINRLVEGTSLPRVPEEVIEGTIHCDALGLLGIE